MLQGPPARVLLQPRRTQTDLFRPQSDDVRRRQARRRDNLDPGCFSRWQVQCRAQERHDAPGRRESRSCRVEEVRSGAFASRSRHARHTGLGDAVREKRTADSGGRLSSETFAQSGRSFCSKEEEEKEAESCSEPASAGSAGAQVGGLSVANSPSSFSGRPRRSSQPSAFTAAATRRSSSSNCPYSTNESDQTARNCRCSCYVSCPRYACHFSAFNYGGSVDSGCNCRNTYFVCQWCSHVYSDYKLIVWTARPHCA